MAWWKNRIHLWLYFSNSKTGSVCDQIKKGGNNFSTHLYLICLFFPCRVARGEQRSRSLIQESGSSLQCLQAETQSRTDWPARYTEICFITVHTSASSHQWEWRREKLLIFNFMLCCDPQIENTLVHVVWLNCFYSSTQEDIRTVATMLVVLVCCITLHRCTWWTCCRLLHRCPPRFPQTDAASPQMKGNKDVTCCRSDCLWEDQTW